MRHLSIGVFHDDTLGKELGKKGTLSDIAMYDRKSEDCILTFMSPVEDKLSTKSQIISIIDTAIVVFSQMTRALGETVLLLDLMGVRDGIIVTGPYATADNVSSIVEKTSLKSFRIEERDPVRLLELLKGVTPARDNASPPAIVIDHSFNVKGVGEVVLGFVKRGIVKKYDTLNLLPVGKEVLVRSIQVHDEDMESVEAGTRVGLALKGASVDELERGYVLSASDQFKIDSKTQLSFSKVPFYAEEIRQGAFHATVGMQTFPLTIRDIMPESIVIETSKPIVYESADIAIMLDLNAKKTRVMGKGKFATT